MRDAHVHSITVTEDSCQHLEGVKQDNGLDNCTVSKTNFWDLPEHQQYDAIVCLGTIEHLPYYDKLMTKANGLLKDGGFLHVDGFAAKQWSFKRNPFMYKYIYPGDNTPFFLAEYLSSVERSTFLLREVKNDDYNYYRTILSWSQRFENNVAQLTSQGISEAMIRIFRLYLWGITHRYKNRGIHAYRVVAQKPNVNTTFPTMQMV
jgi:cyclopropane-fatty-acyl-phospholipid synthase